MSSDPHRSINRVCTEEEIEALTVIANHILDMLERDKRPDGSEHSYMRIEITGVRGWDPIDSVDLAEFESWR